MQVRKLSTQQKLNNLFETKQLNYQRVSKLEIHGESHIKLEDTPCDSEITPSENYEKEKFEEIDEKGVIEQSEPEINESYIEMSRNRSRMTGMSSVNVKKLQKLALNSEKKILKDYQYFSSKSFRNYVDDRQNLNYFHKPQNLKKVNPTSSPFQSSLKPQILAKSVSKKQIIQQQKNEYLYDDPLSKSINNQNQQSVPGSSIQSITYNLIKSQVEAKKQEKSVIQNEDKNQKIEMKAFLELDTRRFQIKKQQCEKIDKKFSQRFAKFQNIENALRQHQQFPATGFHSLVTKKLDQSLESPLKTKTASRILGSIQSIESLKTIQTNESIILPQKSNILSDYHSSNIKKVHFDQQKYLKNSSNISSMQILETEQDIYSQNDEIIVPPKKQKQKVPIQLNEGVTAFSPYSIALKNQINKGAHRNTMISKQGQYINIEQESQKSQNEQNVNFDPADPNAPVIRDNGNLGALSADLSISQLPTNMKIEHGMTNNSYEQVSTTDLAQKLKERSSQHKQKLSKSSMMTAQKQLAKNKTRVFANNQNFEIGTVKLTSDYSPNPSPTRISSKIFGNNLISDVSNSLILHQRPQIFTKKDYPTVSHSPQKIKAEMDSIMNLRSSLDQKFGKMGLEGVRNSMSLNGSLDNDIKIQNNNYSDRREDSMTEFTTATNKKQKTEISQNVFNTLNSVRYNKNTIFRNIDSTKSAQDTPIPKFHQLKSIQQHIEFKDKLKRMKKETNIAKSVNGYPKGIFLQTKNDRNQYRQWKGVEKLRKSEFQINYQELLEQKRNTQEDTVGKQLIQKSSSKNSLKSSLISKGMKSNQTSPSEMNTIDRVLKREKNFQQILPDIVRISLTDMSSLERMSEKNKRSYIERFGNVLMRNSEIKKSFKTHHDTASMLNNR